MALPNIDTDLFVNSYLKGVQAGNAAPSMFSSFIGGLTKGIENQQKWESEEQQQVIRQNQIDQIPVANRMQEAQATMAEANVAAYKDDPQKFVAAQKAKEDEILRKQEEAQRLEKQRTEFMGIMQGSDNKAKLDAMTNGKFTEYLAADPNIRKEVLKQATGWEPENYEPLYQSEYAQLRAQHIADTKLQSQLTFEESARNYQNDGNVGQLENDVAHAFPKESINRLDLALYGEVRTREKYHMVEGETKPGPDGKPVRTYVEDKTKRPEIVKEFYYGKGEEKQLVREIDNDTFKIYDKFQKDYRRINDLEPSSGGLADLQKQARRNNEQREQAKAKAEAEAKEKMGYQGPAEYFNAGVKAPVAPTLNGRTPQFNKALQAGRGKMQQNAEEARPQPSVPPTPQSSAAPQVTQSGNALQLPPTPIPTAKAREAAIPQLAPQGPAPTEAPGPEPTKSPAQQKKEEVKERGAAKTRMWLEKRGVAPAPAATAQQVSLVTPAKYIPDTMTPLTTLRYKVSDETINRVESIPGMKYAPALVKAVIAIESEGKMNAKSPTGVEGLAQMEKATARGLFGDSFDPMNPEHNVLGATTMLEVAMANPVMKGNPALAIAAYNGGEPVIADAVRRSGGSTDWNIVKQYIPAAVSANPKLSRIKGKATEIIQYVDKVVSAFPNFARSSNDYEMAQRLKGAGLLDYQETNNSPLKYA